MFSSRFHIGREQTAEHHNSHGCSPRCKIGDLQPTAIAISAKPVRHTQKAARPIASGTMRIISALPFPQCAEAVRRNMAPRAARSARCQSAKWGQKIPRIRKQINAAMRQIRGAIEGRTSNRDSVNVIDRSSQRNLATELGNSRYSAVNFRTGTSAAGEESVDKYRSFFQDDEDDTLLFEKLQEHVLERYPNPERKGCLDHSTLEKWVCSPERLDLSDPKYLHVLSMPSVQRS